MVDDMTFLLHGIGLVRGSCRQQDREGGHETIGHSLLFTSETVLHGI